MFTIIRWTLEWLCLKARRNLAKEFSSNHLSGIGRIRGKPRISWSTWQLRAGSILTINSHKIRWLKWWTIRNQASFLTDKYRTARDWGRCWFCWHRESKDYFNWSGVATSECRISWRRRNNRRDLAVNIDSPFRWYKDTRSIMGWFQRRGNGPWFWTFKLFCKKSYTMFIDIFSSNFETKRNNYLRD